ncbi:hypothetical protein [Salinibacillus xinjiangensis]|uniref:hypothetical protein n=1 Tax=Salinibacillus xinjiangensis TaxID=1229268 RepID=UPI001E340E64|nr:hypothetical protein [Salinibacillus xinjiangensis]
MADLLFVGMHPSFFSYSNPTQWVNILHEVSIPDEYKDWTTILFIRNLEVLKDM